MADLRASKENAKRAGERLVELQNGTANGKTLTGHMRDSRFDYIEKFIRAAQRKLPSEAAYERERKRNRKQPA